MSILVEGNLSLSMMMSCITLLRQLPYMTSWSSSSIILLLTLVPDPYAKDWSWDKRFFGITFPSSSIVLWSWMFIGASCAPSRSIIFSFSITNCHPWRTSSSIISVNNFGLFMTPL